MGFKPKLSHDMTWMCQQTNQGFMLQSAGDYPLLFENTLISCIPYYALSYLWPPGTIRRQPRCLDTLAVLLLPGVQADGCIGCFWAEWRMELPDSADSAQDSTGRSTPTAALEACAQLSKAGLTSALAIMISSATVSPARKTEPMTSTMYWPALLVRSWIGGLPKLDKVSFWKSNCFPNFLKADLEISNGADPCTIEALMTPQWGPRETSIATPMWLVNLSIAKTELVRLLNRSGLFRPRWRHSFSNSANAGEPTIVLPHPESSTLKPGLETRLISFTSDPEVFSEHCKRMWSSKEGRGYRAATNDGTISTRAAPVDALSEEEAACAAWPLFVFGWGRAALTSTVALLATFVTGCLSLQFLHSYAVRTTDITRFAKLSLLLQTIEFLSFVTPRSRQHLCDVRLFEGLLRLCLQWQLMILQQLIDVSEFFNLTQVVIFHGWSLIFHQGNSFPTGNTEIRVTGAESYGNWPSLQVSTSSGDDHGTLFTWKSSSIQHDPSPSFLWKLHSLWQSIASSIHRP